MPRKTHYNPERAIHNRVADPKRAQKRIAARQAFDRQIAKERAIGVDPQFDHSRGRTDYARDEARVVWLKASRTYDEGRYDH